jgi:hypothetical protein
MSSLEITQRAYKGKLMIDIRPLRNCGSRHISPPSCEPSTMPTTLPTA